ncbi:MAG TPA: ATP-binding protein [Ornithinibacter sp.]|nr:ATP-binding protein [Ornithinibacter sp.]HQA14284.1 ATP-binding protein [Ornithinibacter sp.]HQD68146.1 ATP-binding protein [Ornithinibacter sp.]
MTGATDSPFHVDLRGVVDLLSQHLYSGPRVYLRELLQNSLDAVTARTQDDPQAPRRVRIVPADLSPDGCLHVDDSGIGLDEDGIRAVLATIGASTKRDALGLARESFLGQFGIGLLSCFLVTDEIRVTTRRAGTDETWLWVGRDDGTYSVAPSPQPRAEPGTDVALRPRGSAADLLSAEVVERLASSYASYLPVDLVVETAGGPVIAAGRRFPWEGGGRDAALSLGESVVGARPLDVVDLSDPVSGVRGQAFVLPHPTGTRGGHRLYAKRMLVGESVPDVLPDWAFFVRAVLDTERLALTASRESLADDDVLGQTRARLGDQLKCWLLRMARTDRARAQEFFGVHHLGQVAAIARAEDIAVLNAGYAYDRTILERWVARTDGVEAVRLEPEHLAGRFSDPDPDEAAAFAPLLDVARQVLGRSEVRPVVRSFRPATMHAVLLVGRDAHRERDRRDVAAAVDDPWSAALAEIAEPDAVARFVLNAEHHAVRRLADCGDAELQRVALEALYAHALLAGRHPLTPFDSALVARALPALIDRAVDGGPA